MNCAPSLVIAFHFLLQVNGCRDGLNFTIHPVTAYAGETVSFVCFINASATAELVVNASGHGEATCGLVEQVQRKSGLFDKGGTVNCSRSDGMTSLTTLVNATIEMEKWSYTCQAIIYSGPSPKERCSSDTTTIKVTEVPQLYLIPEDMAINDTQMVTIICSTNSSNPVNVTLALRGKTVAASQRSVNVTIAASRDLHDAEVRCEAPELQRVVPNTTTIRVNYIFVNESIIAYHTANSSHTFDCGKFVKSYPGVHYKWFVNSTQMMETQSSYTCEASQWCNTSVTCVVTNNVTHVQSNVTFIYQKDQSESRTIVNRSRTKENGSQIDMEIIVVIAACLGGTIVVASIVAVLVWKRCISRRSVGQSSRLLCCKKKEEVIDMTDNELYEAVPMMPAAATSVRPEASLVVACATVTGNLKHKVRSNSHLVLFSDHSSTLRDIQGKIEETVPTRNSVNQVAFLLRRTNKRLVLSLSDNVHIDGNSIASDRRLRDFLKQLIERNVDMSSNELRLDLLNYPDLGASKEEKVAKKLTALLGIPVFLSHDMYGVTRGIDDKRCVADVYFNRRHIENQVIYAEVDLSKDSRRFPADSQEKVVYSEVIRPALRPPLSAGQ